MDPVRRLNVTSDNDGDDPASECECGRSNTQMGTRSPNSRSDNRNRSRAKQSGSLRADRPRTPRRTRNGKLVPTKCSERLQQMALPLVRVLKDNRAQFRPYSSRKHFVGLGKTLAKSKASMYSKMAKRLCESPSTAHYMDYKERQKGATLDNKSGKGQTSDNCCVCDDDSRPATSDVVEKSTKVEKPKQNKNDQKYVDCPGNDTVETPKSAKINKKPKQDGGKAKPARNDLSAECYCVSRADKLAAKRDGESSQDTTKNVGKNSKRSQSQHNLEDECSERLQQMALPRVRYLRGTRAVIRPFASQTRIEFIDKRIVQSKTSVYSQMAKSNCSQTDKNSAKLNRNASGRNQSASGRNQKTNKIKKSKSCHCLNLRSDRSQGRSQQGKSKSKSGHTLAEECSERLQQMALPRVRVLKDTRTKLRPFASQSRIEGISMTMQKSKTSMYSKMAKRLCETPRSLNKNRKTDGAQNSKQNRKTNKAKSSTFCGCFKKQDNSCHCEMAADDWADRLARPKRRFSELIFDRPGKIGQIDYIRQDELAKPKWITKMYPDGAVPGIYSPIKPSVLTYEITPRLLALTAPHKSPPQLDEGCWCYERPYPVPAKYAGIESHGIAALATPKRKRERYVKVAAIAPIATTETDPNEAPREFKASERILKLSKPLVRDVPCKAHPFAVSKAAMSKKPLKSKQAEFYKNLSKPNSRT